MIGAGIHDEGPRTLFNLNERNLHRILRSYLDYYHNCRTHLSLNKDPPRSQTDRADRGRQDSCIPAHRWASSSVYAISGVSSANKELPG